MGDVRDLLHITTANKPWLLLICIISFFSSLLLSALPIYIYSIIACPFIEKCMVSFCATQARNQERNLFTLYMRI